jgi:hypothetical protein
MISGGRWLAAAASCGVVLSTAAHGEIAGADAADGLEAAPQTSAPSAPPAIPVFRPEEELLLQVRTDKWILDQAFSGYSTPTGTYLPLGALSRLLDLAISVDAENGQAEGWYLDPSNTFRLNTKSGFVETKNGRKLLKPGDAVAVLGDIYVRPALLSQWFPLEADVSLPKQQVELKLLATFPFEAKMEREEKRDLIGVGNTRISYPREVTPYELLSTPALDINVRATTGNKQPSTSEYDVRASGDLAFMNADVFVSGDRTDPVRDMRFVLRRRDPDSNLLGPLHLSLVELGDTASLAEPIGVTTRTGRGFVIGNIPVDRGSVFDKIDLRGELPIGYEVELYRNDVLIGAVDRGVGGRYEFLQVPLEFGLNVLRFVFYGPHGERREEIRQINAGEGRLSKGEFQFAAGAVQQDKNLIPLHSGSFDSLLLDRGALRAVASAQYGLSSRISAMGGLASFEVNGNRINQGNAGIRTSLGSSALQLDAAFQDKGAWALQAGFAGRLLGTSYVFQHAEYGGDFIDELRNVVGLPYRRYSQLRLDRGFRLGSSTLGTNFVAERSQFGDTTQWDATLRASTSVFRWLLSNSLNYRRFSNSSVSTENLDGTFEVNGAVAGWGVRAGINYYLKPGSKFRDFNIAVDRTFWRGAVIRATLQHELSGGKATRGGVSLSRRFGAFDLGGDVFYDSATKAFVFGTRASFSFGKWLGAWRFEPPGLARSGSLVAVAFQDMNGDGIQEAGEPPLEGIGFRGGTGQLVTNGAGKTLISGLGDGRPAQVAMLTESLPDPYMYPSRPGVEVVPRPGRTHVAYFPVALVSELEGHAFFGSGGTHRAVSNVQLQLVDKKGAVIASAKTEYDGYFFIDKVSPGEYQLKLDPEQAAKLNIQLSGPVSVKATAEGGLIGKIEVNVVPSSPATPK